MRRLVLKFGGSSVANIEKIKHAAKVVMEHAQNAQVIVVVSAMQGETNRLLSLAKEAYNPLSAHREFDQIIATGEVVSAGLMALSLESFGLQARSLTATQAGICTNNSFQNASIENIATDTINQTLDQGMIPIVAGFQGITGQHVTTLGRGGSDLTAVALAHALDADICWIYTDVKGVYAIDPNIIPNEFIFEQINYHVLKRMALFGAEVIQYAAIQYAQAQKVPVRISSTFHPDMGSLVTDTQMPHRPIVVRHAGVTQLTDTQTERPTYQTLFEDKVLLKHGSSLLLTMILPEIKRKLRLSDHNHDHLDLRADQTLISIFLSSDQAFDQMFEHIEGCQTFKIFMSNKAKHVIRILVDDYQTVTIMAKINAFAELKSATI